MAPGLSGILPRMATRTSVNPHHDEYGLRERYADHNEPKEQHKLEGEVLLGFRLYVIRDISHATYQFRASFRCFYEWCDPVLAARLMRAGAASTSPRRCSTSGIADEADWAPFIPEVTFTNASRLEPEPCDEQTPTDQAADVFC